MSALILDEQTTGEYTTDEQTTGEQAMGEQAMGEQAMGEQAMGEQAMGEHTGSPLRVTITMNKFDPKIHHRQSIRLQGYDYSRAGLYFITICCQNRECLFGDIVDGKMVLNNAGEMIEKWYFELENKFFDIKCHPMIVMPNHIHFIVENVGADLRVCPDSGGTHNGGTHNGNRQRANTQVRPYNSPNNGQKNGRTHNGRTHRFAPTSGCAMV